MKQDPVRLFDDPQASQTLRADLRAAERDPGPRYDLEAETRRFGALVGSDGVVATTAAAAGGAAKVIPFGLKVVGVVMIGLVGGAVTLKMLSTGSSGMSGGTTNAIPSPESVAHLPAIDRAAAVAENSVSAVDPSAAVPVKAKPTRPSSVRRALPGDQPVTTSPSISGAAAPEGTGPAAVDSIAPVAASSSALKEEMSQLAEIRSLARTNPARAVDLVREGHARFSHGVFWQERELLAITSLVSLGRQDDARQRASAVLKRHPESPFAETLRRVIAGAAAPIFPAVPR